MSRRRVGAAAHHRGIIRARRYDRLRIQTQSILVQGRADPFRSLHLTGLFQQLVVILAGGVDGCRVAGGIGGRKQLVRVPLVGIDPDHADADANG